jgi:hypothetical protein
MTGIRLVMASGDPAMIVDTISPEGDRLCVRGRLLGTMQARMYLGPTEVLGLARLCLRGPVLAYLLRLPFLYWRSKTKGYRDESLRGPENRQK